MLDWTYQSTKMSKNPKMNNFLVKANENLWSAQCSSTTSCNVNSSSRLEIINGINNLRLLSRIHLRIHWKWSEYQSLWISLLCLLVLVESSVVVVAYPAAFSSSLSSSSSRSSSSGKGIQSTTLHSLQQSVDSGSSLSIVSSIDVLRQNIMLEIVRKHIRHAKQRQLQSNKEFLDRIG